MLLRIKDKEYEIRFGIRFVRELDKKYNVTYVAGSKMGYGIEAVVPQLLTGSATALAEILYTGTVTCPERPSMDDIDEYIDSIEDYDKFVDGVVDELKKQNATRTKVAELVKNLEESQKKNPEKKSNGLKMPATK